jgi:hypothetical protein
MLSAFLVQTVASAFVSPCSPVQLDPRARVLADRGVCGVSGRALAASDCISWICDDFAASTKGTVASQPPEEKRRKKRSTRRRLKKPA